MKTIKGITVLILLSKAFSYPSLVNRQPSSCTYKPETAADYPTADHNIHHNAVDVVILFRGLCGSRRVHSWGEQLLH